MLADVQTSSLKSGAINAMKVDDIDNTVPLYSYMSYRYNWIYSVYIYRSFTCQWQFVQHTFPCHRRIWSVYCLWWLGKSAACIEMGYFHFQHVLVFVDSLCSWDSLKSLCVDLPAFATHTGYSVYMYIEYIQETCSFGLPGFFSKSNGSVLLFHVHDRSGGN